MISKLDPIKSFDCGDTPQANMRHHSYHNDCINKINELVDAINRHEDIIRQIGEWGSSKNECLWCENITKVNLNDPYTEQRQWIGCVCRFWFDNPNDTLLDYLEKIQMGQNGVVQYYSKESGDWFPHCEPVKPTDDIIYKGGNNE